MSNPLTEVPDYPFCTDSYIACLDDGNWVRNELKQATTGSWRAEKFAADSNVLVCDHDQGTGNWRYCNDRQIDQILQEPKRPQLRIFILQPTIHQRVLSDTQAEIDMKTAAASYDNELGLGRAQMEAPVTPETRDLLNVSHGALLKILTKYDFAPASCSHIRGQEQVFGSRIARAGERITGFGYAIRARAYYLHQNLDADLKITVCTKYDVATGTSVMIFKYRSFNELPTELKRELVQKVKDFVMDQSAQLVAGNPVAPFLSHLFTTLQWYRRAARDPRDNVRREEEKVHEPGRRESKEVDGIVGRLHLSMRSLDQDILQLGFILDVIGRLRKQHDIFYTVIKKKPETSDRDWLYFRVDDELDRLENHIIYMRSLTSDVRKRAQRLLELIFNLSTLENARWSESIGRQAMQENVAVKAIAIVSMLFLPGSFICSVLGTNFFSMPDDEPWNLIISPQWWILPVTIVSSTVLCIAAFASWRRVIKRRFRRKDEEA